MPRQKGQIWILYECKHLTKPVLHTKGWIVESAFWTFLPWDPINLLSFIWWHRLVWYFTNSFSSMKKGCGLLLQVLASCKGRYLELSRISWKVYSVICISICDSVLRRERPCKIVLSCTSLLHEWRFSSSSLRFSEYRSKVSCLLACLFD